MARMLSVSYVSVVVSESRWETKEGRQMAVQ